jgi:ABC-2 type transport system permease protein
VRHALFLRIVGIESRKRLAYRADFWIQSFAVFGSELGLVWFLWQAMFAARGTDRIAGMDLSSTILYYVAVILVAKLARGPDLAEDVSNDIYEGGLNRYLVYPVPYFGFKYAQNLGALTPALVQLALFLAVAPLVLRGGEAGVSALSVGMCLVSVLVGNLLYQLMTWPLSGLAFWADNVWSLLVALRLVSGLLGGVMLPLAVFPEWSQPLLAALPFRHCFSVPALALLGRTDLATWLLDLAAAGAWCVGFALLTRAVFARGRLRYTGVGI